MKPWSSGVELGATVGTSRMAVALGTAAFAVASPGTGVATPLSPRIAEAPPPPHAAMKIIIATRLAIAVDELR
jgi:hypothetical protein